MFSATSSPNFDCVESRGEAFLAIKVCKSVTSSHEVKKISLNKSKILGFPSPLSVT